MCVFVYMIQKERGNRSTKMLSGICRAFKSIASWQNERYHDVEER